VLIVATPSDKYASESVGVRVLDGRDRTALQALPSSSFIIGHTAYPRCRDSGLQDRASLPLA
jgi:hypothetical protein